MAKILLVTLAALTLLGAALATAQVTGEADPLFASHQILDARITAPIKTLMRERPEDDELPGTLSWTDATGATTEVSVAIRTRGNYRRQRDVCPFAPLRLNLKKSEVKNTLFDKQDKLKLVTHCRTGVTRYEQGLLREYLVYRMFNQITDLSYRVRLLRIVYTDSETNKTFKPMFGFLIESDRRLAKRTGLPWVDLRAAKLSALNPAYTNLTSLFHYFIGNTDYSPLAGPEGDTCCHNSSLFGSQDTGLFPVPYDFDMSGMVDAKYATPNPRFDLRDVQQRLYRGRCGFKAQIPDSVQAFRAHETQMHELIDAEANLRKGTRRAMHRYVDQFYDTLSDPDEIRTKIAEQCIG